MTKNIKILIIVLVAIAMGFGIYMITAGSREPIYTVSWKQSYSPTDKGPYGTYVFKELLDTTGLFESFIQLDSKIEQQLTDVKGVNDLYFFIGKKNYMSDDAFTALLEFVSNGNTAFISAEQMPYHILDYFFTDMNGVYEYTSDSMQNFSFLAPEFSTNNYEFSFINRNKVTTYNWAYFTPENIVFQTDTPLVLGKSTDGKINFIEIPYFKGRFFFHTNPYQLSNISLFRFSGFPYAEALIHHLPYGKIQWDVYNLVKRNATGRQGGGSAENRSTLQFIFQHTALIWAFALLFISGILYAIFKGKRRQNIVPAIELKENSSLNYIETVSSLYLQERQHHKLIRLQKQSFIEFIGNHYYIRSHKIDDKYIATLSLKSGILPAKITAIFSHLETLANQTNVTDAELIGLQQKIEHFYKTCK